MGDGGLNVAIVGVGFGGCVLRQAQDEFGGFGMSLAGGGVGLAGSGWVWGVRDECGGFGMGLGG